MKISRRIIKINIKKISYIFIFLFLFFIIFIFYGNILRTWFQQDEWSLFGRYTYLNSLYKIPALGAFLWNFFPDPRFAFNPLSDSVFALMVKLWGVNFAPYAIVSLLLHTTNAFLVFILVKKLTKNLGLSWLSSIIFATSATGQKAITWIMTSINTQGAATLALLTLLVFHKFIETRKLTWFFFVFPLLLASLWFKETTMPMFFILIAFSLLFAGSWKKHKTFHIRIISFTTIFFVCFFIARILLSVYGVKMHQDYVKLPRMLTPREYLKVILWVPVKAPVDAFILPNTLYFLGSKYTSAMTEYRKETIQFGRFAETTAIYIMSLLLLIPALFFLLIVYKLISRNENLKRVYFLALMIQLSSMIVALLLIVRGTAALSGMLRSRDMYFSNVGSSIILALFFLFIWKKIKLFQFRVVLLAVLGFFMFYHWNYINNFELTREIRKAEMRKPIVGTVYSRYPTLPKKIIFYTQSDTPFYGSATPGMPFQTGFGRTLLVWYSLKNNDRPVEFMKDDFLYLPFSQGYKEIKGSGFGYFTDFEELKKNIKKFNLNQDNIIAFSYESKTNRIIDITPIIREKLE